MLECIFLPEKPSMQESVWSINHYVKNNVGKLLQGGLLIERVVSHNITHTYEGKYMATLVVEYHMNYITKGEGTDRSYDQETTRHPIAH